MPIANHLQSTPEPRRADQSDEDAALIAYLHGRSSPCPQCAYDLRDIKTTQCPECGEPLILKVGSPRPRFGWFVVAIAPGCFSGVAACFVLIPIAMTIGRNLPPGQGAPWPVIAADIFGFTSAASVLLIYRFRHRILAWSTRRQFWFAFLVWSIHAMALALFALAMWLVT